MEQRNDLEIGNLVRNTKINHPVWCLGEIYFIDGEKVGVKLVQGCDSWEAKDLQVVDADTEVKKTLEGK